MLVTHSYVYYLPTHVNTSPAKGTSLLWVCTYLGTRTINITSSPISFLWSTVQRKVELNHCTYVIKDLVKVSRKIPYGWKNNYQFWNWFRIIFSTLFSIQSAINITAPYWKWRFWINSVLKQRKCVIELLTVSFGKYVPMTS